ncbi:MAG: DUF4167 domain-containing protein [Bdellovibrionales bacterium]
MNDRNHSIRQPSSGTRRPRSRHPSSGGSNGGNEGRQSSGNNNSMRGDNRPRSAASLRHQSFDSNGPDVRVRGNAWQVYEKYQSLARDATSAGDRVMAESYLQHAEHYYRVTEAIEEATTAEQQHQRGGSGSSPQTQLPAQPQAPFGSQPDMPSNYYTPEGKGPNAPASQPTAAGEGQQPQPQAQSARPRAERVSEQREDMPQAEVTRRTPPPVSALFSSDDDESGSNPQTLVAGK